MDNTDVNNIIYNNYYINYNSNNNSNADILHTNEKIEHFFNIYPNIEEKYKETIRNILLKDFEIVSLYNIDRCNIGKRLADWVIQYLEKGKADNNFIRDIYTIKYFTIKKASTKTTLSRYLSMNLNDYIKYVDKYYSLDDNKNLCIKKDGKIYKVIVGPLPIDKYHRYLGEGAERRIHCVPSKMRKLILNDGYYVIESELVEDMPDCEICSITKRGKYVKKESKDEAALKKESKDEAAPTNLQVLTVPKIIPTIEPVSKPPASNLPVSAVQTTPTKPPPKISSTPAKPATQNHLSKNKKANKLNSKSKQIEKEKEQEQKQEQKQEQEKEQEQKQEQEQEQKQKQEQENEEKKNLKRKKDDEYYINEYLNDPSSENQPTVQQNTRKNITRSRSNLKETRVDKIGESQESYQKNVTKKPASKKPASKKPASKKPATKK